MIHTSEIMNALITNGLTYSPEAGDPYPMRALPAHQVARVVSQFLIDHHVPVNVDVTDEPVPLGHGKKLYYEARAELHAQLAEQVDNPASRVYHQNREREYRNMAGQL
jgi:hypothetical protein